MAEKRVYFFGGGQAEGSAKMKDLLGGKGANLAEMTSLGIPVPPGFTITAKMCEQYYKNGRKNSDDLVEEVEEHLHRLESTVGKKLGDKDSPLLVSVRSGAAVSMPGMMDTILNLGLNDEAVIGLQKSTNNERLAWDSYRRFINMFGNVVMGIPHEEFEKEMDKVKYKKNVEEDVDLDANDLKELVKLYKALYKKQTHEDFPQDPLDQLWKAINAVFGSWNNPKAIKYRKINDIKDLLGTAVSVVAMVFGNFGDDSGTGVCFSRDPSTGEKMFYGEYLMNAQGEDVVAGIRTPKRITTLQDQDPKLFQTLVDVKDRLEKHYRDMQDMEFTIQEGKLYLLQTRNAKRTGAAAIKVAVDMVSEGVISKEEALTRVTPLQLEQVFHPAIHPATKKKVKAIAKGLNASPGAATGQIVFSADEAEEWHAEGKKVLLVRPETSPEDIGGMDVAEGILTSTGGMTSHAAVVARGMGKPCIAGCKEAQIVNKKMVIKGQEFKEGDWITLDGASGEVFEGKLELKEPEIKGELTTFLSWADEVRIHSYRASKGLKGFGVRTNADTSTDAQRARDFGAEGIGLCRTEHMFFEEEKIKIFREMIVAADDEARKKALDKLLPLQQKDFVGIFEVMNGFPVTIRLLDPPLHEFVPKDDDQIKELAKIAGISAQALKNKIRSLHEENPMLGHRGVRLGITFPEIYRMQAEAIMRAACEAALKGVQVYPEIMIPLVGHIRELEIMRGHVEEVAKKVLQETKAKIDYKIGTMIEVPRATLVADELAHHADFFSFGTNDLTQMTYGFSRDDVGSFVPQYIQEGILEDDPFAKLDQEGIGQLIELGIGKGRDTNKYLKIGICGEHGGEPSSVDFCYRAGMNYVSCSPFRVPVARLSAAQSVLSNQK
ncbi:pyruvate, phosphate dikinase [Salinispira pacifica]|uniref:Pyruvate, phosphate dikinase n=1 Tax=Salinispira pacifica TaxID=1307761 RepID=V5WGR6_9SPIO|nr:pyruvate, phosphate dikinase [Salinispira pacifica]AHC14356.1 Pyruvate,phosphate dikinase [Salinispira pacifica]